jgi:hypothetical protein
MAVAGRGRKASTPVRSKALKNLLIFIECFRLNVPSGGEAAETAYILNK